MPRELHTAQGPRHWHEKGFGEFLSKIHLALSDRSVARSGGSLERKEKKCVFLSVKSLHSSLNKQGKDEGFIFRPLFAFDDPTTVICIKE